MMVLTLTHILVLTIQLEVVLNRISLVVLKIEQHLMLLKQQVVVVVTHTTLLELLVHLMGQVNLLVAVIQLTIDHHIMHYVTS